MQIERGIPIPAGRGADKKPLRILLESLEFEVGCSVFVAGKKRTAVLQMCADIRKACGRKYRTAEVDGGTRVWRIE